MGASFSISLWAKVMNNVGTAYVLWLGCLLQLHGLQRLYNGKVLTGFLWLFTFGLFGVGQLIDLVLIPGMVDEYNSKHNKQGVLPYATHPQPTIQRVIPAATRQDPPTISLAPGASEAWRTAPPDRDRLLIELVKAAHARNGQISVTQAVMDTEAPFSEVEASLQHLVKLGYVDVYNHPETGVVTYDFREL